MKPLIDLAEDLVAEMHGDGGSPAARAACAVLLLRRAAADLQTRMRELEADEERLALMLSFRALVEGGRHA